MTQRIFTYEIANFLASQIFTNLQVSLSLKTSQVGDIAFYSSVDELVSVVPAVLVKPIATNVGVRTLQANWEAVYQFRIAVIRPFAVGDNVVQQKIADVNSIAELIFDNTRLTGLTLNNGSVNLAKVVSVDYQPPEEGFIALMKGEYYVSVVVAEITVQNVIA